MSTSRKLSTAFVATLTATALAAPGAGAMPMHESSEFDAGHASVATAASRAQDMRSPDARDASLKPARNAGPSTSIARFGPPTWPAYPTPLHTVQAQPPVPTDDDSPVWVPLLIGLGSIG